LGGTNGIPTATYYVLAPTNLALPAANWTVMATNTFDADGNFNFNAIPAAGARTQFYRVKCALLELP
jgi:hypothetical protein